MTDIHIRPARRSDGTSVAAIYAPYVTDSAVSFESTPPDGAAMGQRIETAVRDRAWLVAERGDEIIGYAYATGFRPREAYRWTVEISAYVDTGYHGRGVGRALYDQLLPTLATRGFCNAIAVIALPNPASLSFHESVGFELIGTLARVGRKFGIWHDVAWYQKILRDEPPEASLHPSIWGPLTK